MKFWISTLAVALLSFIVGLFSAWWTFSIVAALIGSSIPQRGGWSFLSGFLGVFTLWIGLTLWIDQSNGGILSVRMAQVLPLGGNIFLLHLLTALLGGLIGGLSALTGKLIRSVFSSKSS